MSERNDGGPAFPLNPDTNFSHKGEVYRECMGMTLRDWFAGQAVAGVLMRIEGEASNFEEVGNLAAIAAYAVADAMIARNAKDGKE